MVLVILPIKILNGNKNGDVTFGKNVTMTWDNLDQSVKDEISQ